MNPRRRRHRKRVRSLRRHSPYQAWWSWAHQQRIKDDVFYSFAKRRNRGEA